jgi:acetyltransferase
MVTRQLIDPKSIVVVGGSNDIHKPGGKVLFNILKGEYPGPVYVVNPKEAEVQGCRSFADVKELPPAELAIIAIAARYTPDVVEILATEKGTRAFIILSAGYSEESKEGALLEERIVNTVKEYGASLIGPNCIGVLTPAYQGVFTEPIPVLEEGGCDFISGSGATACFILEAGIPKGLRFASVFSVGNSAQLGVEEILEYLDETYIDGKSSRIKLLYIETVANPHKLLKHASSLIRKGCRIAAVKAGASEAGSRAASSHTGAMASPDLAVDALFRKAGIVRCYGREDLIAVASVFSYPPLTGKRIAIVTHAGGPAVMLTDALSEGGLEVPHISGAKSEELLQLLFPGSSVANPIDFLATGTAEQLGHILEYTDKYFNNIDAIAVIFGTPGLFSIDEVYEVLDRKMKELRKPIFPILPSTLTAAREVKDFLGKGRVNFPDEVNFGKALARVYHTPAPQEEDLPGIAIDKAKIRSIIAGCADGYAEPQTVQELLDAAGIPRVAEAVVKDIDALDLSLKTLGFPLVMKVVGPVHKSDVGGVVLNVLDSATAHREFERLMRIPDTVAVLLQPMHKGKELFAGAKREEGFGHMVMCGMGGIFIEVFKDVATGLAPLRQAEVSKMIHQLRGYKIIRGIRGDKGVNEAAFTEAVVRLSALVEAAPEIAEMDLNPLLGNPEVVVAVDARIRIEKH